MGSTVILLLLGISSNFPRVSRYRHETMEFVKREAREFSAFYRSSPVWWFSSFIGALFAATVGATGGIWFDFLALLIFIFPAFVYYVYFRPFGLQCEYEHSDATNGENSCYPRDGKYSIYLTMRPGTNVNEYRLDVHLPPNVEPASINGVTSSLDKNRQIIYGVASSENGKYGEELYLEKTGSIPPEGELMLITSQGTGRTVESVRLYPSPPNEL